MAQKQYTMADVEVVREFFSDMYKECHGIRPRGFTDEAMIHWVNTTDVQAIIDEQEEQDRLMLEERGFWEPGMTLGAAWNRFYEHKEREHEAKYILRQPKPLTPAEQQFRDDSTLTALEMLDPTLNPRCLA